MRILWRRRLVAGCVATLLLSMMTPALAGPVETVRDAFQHKSYDGNDGTVDWIDNWFEKPFAGGPTSGQIQVGNDGSCDNSNCLRIGPDNMTGLGVYREVDLSSYSQATLTFSYRRDILGGGDGSMLVKASTDGVAWTTLRTYILDNSDAEHIPTTVDLSGWAGDTAMVGFFGDGDFGGYFYVDNVQVAMSFNGSPTFDDPLPDRGDTEGDTVDVTPDVSDPEDDDLTFSATGLPPGISINRDSGVVSGTIGYTAASSSPFTTNITASDRFGGHAVESFSWVVADLNRPPSLDPIGNVFVDEGSVLQVTAIFSDLDLPDDSHTFTLSAGPPGSAVGSGGQIIWTPGESDGPGVVGFTVKVTDSGNPAAADVESFTVTVVETNSSPTLAAIPDRANGAGDTVSLAVSATDPDVPANTLKYSASGLPPGLSISKISGVISGTIPGSASPASYTVTVGVEDDGSPALPASRAFIWQVARGNHSPVLAPIADQEPGSTGVVGFVATATDADPGDTLRYWLAAGIDTIPAGAAINESTGKFTWDPSDSQFGATYRINVGVSDSGTPRLSDAQLVAITLPELNHPPTVAGPGNQLSVEGAAVSLTVDATDPDLPPDTLRFSATRLPPGLSINSVSGGISGEINYEAADGSPYSVTVTVTDDGIPRKSGTATFRWAVEDTNRPPTATPGAVIAIIGEPTLITLEAEDPDGDELEFTVGVNPRAGILDGEGPDVFYTTRGGAVDDVFMFVVSDGEFEAEAEVKIEIRISNAHPTAAPDSYDVTAGTLLRVDAPGVLGNDGDLDADPLTAALVSPPEHGRLVLNQDGSFTYLPDDGFVGGDKFVYVASDPLHDQSTATVLLSIGSPTVAATTLIDEGPRIGVVVASTSLWQPATTSDEAVLAEIPRAIVTALNNSISSLPELRFPLLLLAVALLLGLTFGRISVLPFGAIRRREEGRVQAYDDVHQIGTVVPDGGGGEVFVHGRSLQKVETLTPGQRVRFVAAHTHGRRLALKVWPATSQ